MGVPGNVYRRQYCATDAVLMPPVVASAGDAIVAEVRLGKLDQGECRNAVKDRQSVSGMRLHNPSSRGVHHLHARIKRRWCLRTGLRRIVLYEGISIRILPMRT